MCLLPAFNPLIWSHTSSSPAQPSRKGCLFWLVDVVSRDKIQQSDWFLMVMSTPDWMFWGGAWRKVWDYMCTLCVQFSSSSPLFPHLIVPSPPPEIRCHGTPPRTPDWLYSAHVCAALIPDWLTGFGSPIGFRGCSYVLVPVIVICLFSLPASFLYLVI